MPSLKLRHWIDSHKAATGPFTLALIAAHPHAWDNYTAWTYAALHGTYGLLWVVKSSVFPDASWEKPAGVFKAEGVPVGGGLTVWASLSLYWIAPWVICRDDVRVSAPQLAAAVAAYTVGVFLHFASDMQKHTSLTLRPGKLITDGLFAKVRNVNYLGELLIYGGFSSLAVKQTPLPAMALGAMVLFAWIPNMIRKDKSLSRYPEFEQYKKSSWCFIPLVW